MYRYFFCLYNSWKIDIDHGRVEWGDYGKARDMEKV